ncbi:hypothetical protein E4T56_gene6711 [Termitomyces sp. T112]|nr:hypothetical protein E4T56_gene6711 [Termitomyces sp. T112]
MSRLGTSTHIPGSRGTFSSCQSCQAHSITDERKKVGEYEFAKDLLGKQQLASQSKFGEFVGGEIRLTIPPTPNQIRVVSATNRSCYRSRRSWVTPPW